VTRLWCEHRGRLLLRRGDAKAKRLAGLHELPEASDLGINIPSLREARQGDEAIQLDRHGALRAPRHDKTGTKLLATKRRTITRFAITESIHAVKSSATLLKRIAKNPALEWVPLAQLDRVTLSGPHRRWIGELLARTD
jgi:A/G-specific adenine glycosylase